jgi:hypothetical protein
MPVVVSSVLVPVVAVGTVVLVPPPPFSLSSPQPASPRVRPASPEAASMSGFFMLAEVPEALRLKRTRFALAPAERLPILWRE